MSAIIQENSINAIGQWWNDSSIDIVEIDGINYALHGYNGESFLDCWQVEFASLGGKFYEVLNNQRYKITPNYIINRDINDSVLSVEFIGFTVE